ncbi:hypothetical protein BDF20DRAFT_655405 [Mycotypha africana]|uniref:uncharacterized protein n=1 Tax=Mycotypha africana TaxID=64632 RepID=UPI0023006F6D|nr:uncharacterized protein BDF20DRAFT_655405 [Mycotypha africana]KAI8973495.1 hypothetical protein BDF20DRAFT_655405 [Mycotypha africana]
MRAPQSTILHTATNAISIDADISGSNVKALINLSYLLLSNHMKAPWLNDGIRNLEDIPMSSVERSKINKLIEMTNLMSIMLEDGDIINEVNMPFNNVEESLKKLCLCTTAEDAERVISEMKIQSLHSPIKEDLNEACQPWMKSITEYVTRTLIVDPVLAESVIQLFNYTTPNFFTAYIDYALPYAILHIEDDAVLGIIADCLAVSPTELCKQKAPEILSAIFMEPDKHLKEDAFRRLQRLFRDRKIIGELASNNFTTITVNLAIKVGSPDLSEIVLNALHELDTVSASNLNNTASIVSSFRFTAILIRVSEFILQKRKGVPDKEIQDPFALESLQYLMLTLKDEVANHASHLIKVFENVIEIPGMQEQAFQLWSTFIFLLKKDSLMSHISLIVNGLLNVAYVADSSLCERIADVLNRILIEEDLDIECYQLLPQLPNIKELQTIKEYAEAKKSARMDTSSGNDGTQQVDNCITKILAKLDEYDDGQVLCGLDRLKKMLDNYQPIKKEFDSLYAKLYNLIKKYASHADITYQAAICLGKLGARNPGDINMKTIDDTVFVTNDFLNDLETWNFISDLIQNHIYPVYQVVTKEDTTPRQRLEYTIQTLLQGIIGVNPSASARQQEHERTAAFQKFPPFLQEVLRPFLNSSYQIQYTAKETEGYPIFKKADTFQQWIKQWYIEMAHNATGTAKKVFFACIPIVESDLTDITAYLIPYLVLHTVVSHKKESDEQSKVVEQLVNELMDVFTANSAQQFSTRHELEEQTQIAPFTEHNDTYHLSVQVAVAVIEYCQKWMNKIRRESAGKNRHVDKVRQFLRCIPSDVMAIAAFNTGAYSQALMYFETYLIERERNPYDFEARRHEVRKIFDYLRLIYIQTENSIDLNALMDSYVIVLNQQHEITRLEDLGEWDYAATLRENEVLNHPDDLIPHIAYMECLRKGSKYDILLTVSDEVSRKVPKWVPHINSFRIDSAWRVQNWKLLDEAVSQPMQRNFLSLVGCALNSMRKGQTKDALSIIEEARQNLIEEFKRGGAARSYRKSYPILYNLQVLQELENSQVIWESTNPAKRIENYTVDWKRTRRQISPNGEYKTQLLEIRKAALFDIRSNDLPQELYEDKILLESKVWLDMAKNYRKAGNSTAALTALTRANTLAHMFNIDYYAEKAKWYWWNGFIEQAQRLLLTRIEEESPGVNMDALLLVDFWNKDPENFRHALPQTVINRVLKVSTEKLEKAYYELMRYHAVRFRDHKSPQTQAKIQTYLISTASKALTHGSKYYYFTMSTLINAWFDIAKLNQEATGKPNDQSRFIMTRFNKIVPTLDRLSEQVPLFHFILYLTRLISRLSTDDERMANWLHKIIYAVFVKYPRQTIWHMVGSLDSQSGLISQRMKDILTKAKGANLDTDIPNIIQEATAVKAFLKKLSQYDVDKTISSLNLGKIGFNGALAKLMNLNLYLPKEITMIPQLPEVINKSRPATVFPEDIPKIHSFDQNVLVMKSLQRPKRITILGNDGKKYYFLLKKEDDLRKDARTIEFENMLNSIFKKNPHCRDKGLYIRTFAVIPLGHQWGLLEWIENLEPLKGIVNGYWEADKKPSVHLISMQWNNSKLETPKEKTEFFLKRLIPQCQSVFYRWFLDRFPEPNQWLNSRTRYVKTLAVMSIVGYILGLGDRHAENILFDNTNGDCVHVDLNMIFDRGAKLPVPEIVPFRLTHNLVGAMGPLGTSGLFRDTCEATLRVLVENKDSLTSVFETYVNEISATANVSLSFPTHKKSIDKKCIFLYLRFITIFILPLFSHHLPML